MPLYEYKCTDGCTVTTSLRRPVDNRDDDVACDVCGAGAKRLFTLSRVWAPTRAAQ